MLRLALTPRWLLALLGVLAAVGLCAVAGYWQWSRTQTILAAERAAAAQPAPIEQVVGGDDARIPDDAIGRAVTVAGVYDPRLQVAVPHRIHDGAPGYWIVSGVRLPDDSVVAVLRGSVADPTELAAAAPAGSVAVDGVLQPDEGFYGDAAPASGEVAAITHSGLARAWDARVLPGFVVLGEQVPSTQPAPTPVEPTVRTSDVPFPLQNFFYALQWWVFASFAVAVYLRWLWLDARESTRAAPAAAPP